MDEKKLMRYDVEFRGEIVLCLVDIYPDGRREAVSIPFVTGSTLYYRPYDFNRIFDIWLTRKDLDLQEFIDKLGYRNP